LTESFHFSEIIGRLPYMRATVTIAVALESVRRPAALAIHPTTAERIPDDVCFTATDAFYPDQTKRRLIPVVLRGHLHLADFLTRFGVDVNSEHFYWDMFGIPVTFTLMGMCHKETSDEALKLRQIRYLLKFDPAFRVSSSDGWTALTFCWTRRSEQRKRCNEPDVRCAP
jgi:hypothetical protein